MTSANRYQRANRHEKRYPCFRLGDPTDRCRRLCRQMTRCSGKTSWTGSRGQYDAVQARGTAPNMAVLVFATMRNEKHRNDKVYPAPFTCCNAASRADRLLTEGGARMTHVYASVCTCSPSKRSPSKQYMSLEARFRIFDRKRRICTWSAVRKRLAGIKTR